MPYQKARIVRRPEAGYCDEEETGVLAGMEVWVEVGRPEETAVIGSLSGRLGVSQIYRLHPDSAARVQARLGLPHPPHGIDRDAVELLPEFRED